MMVVLEVSLAEWNSEQTDIFASSTNLYIFVECHGRFLALSFGLVRLEDKSQLLKVRASLSLRQPWFHVMNRAAIIWAFST